MARGDGFFSRIANFVRDIFTTEEPRQREYREPPREAPPATTGRRKYHSDTDNWTGRGAITNSQWEALKDIAEENINDYDAIFHSSVLARQVGPRDKDNWYAYKSHPDAFNIYNPDERYADIIEALNAGVSYTELKRILYQQQSSITAYANKDRMTPHQRWINRDRRLPESLYWY